MIDRSRRQILAVLSTLIGIVTGGCFGSKETQLAGNSANQPQSDEQITDAQAYSPSWESLDSHSVPEWYENAKLGVFVHWYPAAVPAYGSGWYAKHMYQDGHQINEYHEQTYGDPSEFSYRNFIRETNVVDPDENFTGESWDPDDWAQLFSAIGARYVVATAEHHDGFPMWDAEYTPWTAVEYGPKRDVIGELATSVRGYGLKFGGSHHGMLNFYDPRYTGAYGHPSFSEQHGPDAQYIKEWYKSLWQMIQHHQPDILWLDGDWTAPAEQWGTKQLLAAYYNQAENSWGKSVVSNDRLGQVRGEHGDFDTYEQRVPDHILVETWEHTRPLGDSWTYNQQETAADILSADQLVELFVDVVAKNGNLLINVGPEADGTIDPLHRETLRGFGAWLEGVEESIYGTTHWVKSEDETPETDIRYTVDEDQLYIFLFEWPQSPIALDIPRFVSVAPDIECTVVGTREEVTVDTKISDETIVFALPDDPPTDVESYAYVLRLSFPSAIDDIGLPDLAPARSEIKVQQKRQRTVELAIPIHNRGTAASSPVAIVAVDAESTHQRFLDQKQAPGIEPNETAVVELEASFQSAKVQAVEVGIDPRADLRQVETANDRLSTTVRPLTPTVTASSTINERFPPEQAIDMDQETFWTSARSDDPARLTIELARPVALGKVIVRNRDGGQSYRITEMGIATGKQKEDLTTKRRIETTATPIEIQLNTAGEASIVQITIFEQNKDGNNRPYADVAAVEIYDPEGDRLV